MFIRSINCFQSSFRYINSIGSRRPALCLSTSSYGSGMDQNSLMENDMLIAVDVNDAVIPNIELSKKKAHSFSSEQPRGIAHRAFSVFLFNSRDELLLTQRSEDKITFPGVWTNTCCSHPLQGLVPDEVDDASFVFPEFSGIKHAAIRKLQHELGMDPKQIPHSKFQFLQRFHYWAADSVTYGKFEPPWGEHEIDYVLFIQCKDRDIHIHPNPEEVAQYKFVTQNEMRRMIFNENDLKWSPWFLGIMERGGWFWWDNLQDALEGKLATKEIEYFDPPKDFWASFNLDGHDKHVGILSKGNK